MLPSTTCQSTTVVESSTPVARPAADVVERERDYLLSIEVPGVAESDVEIRHDRGLLSVSALRRRPEGTRALLREFGTVRFARAFRLPSDGSVDASRIQARLTEGVLEVTLPKSEQAQPRRIPVTGA